MDANVVIAAVRAQREKAEETKLRAQKAELQIITTFIRDVMEEFGNGTEAKRVQRGGYECFIRVEHDYRLNITLYAKEISDCLKSCVYIPVGTDVPVGWIHPLDNTFQMLMNAFMAPLNWDLFRQRMSRFRGCPIQLDFIYVARGTDNE